MQKHSFEDVYYTLCGELCEEHAVPGIENAYAEGSACDVLYNEMSEAYERLRNRLGVIDEDEDVEVIINNLLSIQHILCKKMFLYGKLLR